MSNLETVISEVVVRVVRVRNPGCTVTSVIVVVRVVVGQAVCGPVRVVIIEMELLR